MQLHRFTRDHAPYLFPGVHSPTIACAMKRLLSSDRVAWINFNFANTLICGDWYRDVGDMIAPEADDPGIKTVVSAGELAATGPASAYRPREGKMIFDRPDVMRDEEGRAAGVHAATQVIGDMQRRIAAIKPERGAAYLAATLFRLSADETLFRDDTPAAIFHVAIDVRSRILCSPSGTTCLTSAEVRRVRTALVAVRTAAAKPARPMV